MNGRIQDQAVREKPAAYPGACRMVQVVVAGNGYVVNEHLQTPYETVPSGKPFMVFTTPAALMAYLSEQFVGSPGGLVTPVEPVQAGLVLDTAGDHVEERVNHRHAWGCAARNDDDGVCSCGYASRVGCE